MITITEIQEILPQEYPFLLIDRVLEIEENKRIVAIKNVTMNEHFFTGHFPSEPIMPGVLILEAMAQASIVLYAKSKHVEKSKVKYYFAKADIKWKSPVVPGDQLRIEVDAEKMLLAGGIMSAKALVGERVAAVATIGFSVKHLDDKKK
ncbi:MAG: 3-hydroxyacyl-ACP dehydratase FabZ [Candidatus Omnitrophica bacterium]|nr:3-hydroxyacyl-ACP dehydratase FabZ [Candidatus Omnitrophota bacterium]